MSSATRADRLLIVLPAVIDRQDVSALAARLSGVIARRRPREVVCTAGRAHRADLAAVELLARLRVAARRSGARLVVRDAPPDLLELLELCGLADVLGLEPRREPEEREQAIGVEEERDAGDPIALELDDLE